MIRNQNDAKTQNSNIFSKNEIFQTIISSKVFKQQIAQQVDEFDRENTSIINHVFVLEITSTFNQDEKNLDEKYQRFLAIKKKTQQAKKFLFMKKQENKN
jgi:hypothetical protein